MKFITFEDRKNYSINEIGILCDYEPIPIPEERAETDLESVLIENNWYSDPHYLEDMSDYYADNTNDSVCWWESRHYYDQNRIVALNTVDTNTYMFDVSHSSFVFKRPC